MSNKNKIHVSDWPPKSDDDLRKLIKKLTKGSKHAIARITAFIIFDIMFRDKEFNNLQRFIDHPTDNYFSIFGKFPYNKDVKYFCCKFGLNSNDLTLLSVIISYLNWWIYVILILNIGKLKIQHMDNINRHLELITDSKDLNQQFLSDNVWSLLDYMVDINNIEEFENMYNSVVSYSNNNKPYMTSGILNFCNESRESNEKSHYLNDSQLDSNGDDSVTFTVSVPKFDNHYNFESFFDDTLAENHKSIEEHSELVSACHLSRFKDYGAINDNALGFSPKNIPINSRILIYYNMKKVNNNEEFDFNAKNCSIQLSGTTNISFDEIEYFLAADEKVILNNKRKEKSLQDDINELEELIIVNKSKNQDIKRLRANIEFNSFDLNNNDFSDKSIESDTEQSIDKPKEKSENSPNQKQTSINKYYNKNINNNNNNNNNSSNNNIIQEVIDLLDTDDSINDNNNNNNNNKNNLNEEYNLENNIMVLYNSNLNNNNNNNNYNINNNNNNNNVSDNEYIVEEV